MSNGAGPGIVIGLHVAPLPIGWAGGRIEIDASAKQAEQLLLDQLLRGRAAGDTIASRAGAPFLERRFVLMSLHRADGEERRRLGLWGAVAPCSSDYPAS